MSSHFNNRVLVVGKLGRCSVWIKLDVRGNKLLENQHHSFGLAFYRLYMCRNKDREGPSSGKEADLVDRRNNCIDLFKT